MRRIPVLVIGAVAILLLLGAIAGWVFIAAWVPTQGKALLIRTLEQPGTLTVSIESLRSRPFHGIEVEGILLVERATGTTLAQAPRLSVGIAWWPLLMTREIAFRAEGALTHPCETTVTLSGRYALREQTLALDLQSGDIPLASVREPLRQHLPAPLSDGTVRLKLHLARSAEGGVTARGRVTGSRITGNSPAVRLTGDLVIDGEALLATPTRPWSLEATVTLRDGILEGIQRLPPITRIEATGRLTHERLELSRATGSAFGSPWRLDGTVAFHPLSVELGLAAQVHLAPISEALSPVHNQWQLAGEADLRAVCRGPLGPRPTLDCLAEAAVSDGMLTGARLTTPITDITGRVRYDHLARTMHLDRLEGWLEDAHLTLTATLIQRDPSQLTATLTFPQGEAAVRARLGPEDTVIDEATVTLPATRLRLSGQLAHDPQRASQLSAAGSLELAELSQAPFLNWSALEPWQVQGRTTLEATFDGPLGAWKTSAIRARLRAPQVRIREFPVEQVLCEIEQRDGILRARIPGASLAQGRCVGELTLQHLGPRSAFALRADLVGVHLDRLTQLVPAWRARAARGTASTHLTLLGTWQDRATWGGEGWLSASGEQLGDVPLLDKVFRGVFGALGDRLGLETLRRAQITQLSGQWRLRQERVWTDDLRIGALAGSEPVALYGQGSLGLDQTLDLTIEPELSEHTVLQAPSTATLASAILQAAGRLDRLRRLVGRHRVTGTLKDPNYRFEFSAGELLKQLAPGPGDLFQDFLKSLRLN